MIVRAARLDDGADLHRIDVATHSTRTSPAPLHPERPFFSDPPRPEDVLVAEDDGRVLGWVRVEQPSPLAAHAHVLLVNGLAVDPSAQGRGVGRLLVDAAVEAARQRGARKLALRVLAPNRGARRLYAAAGFVEEGVLRGEFLLDGVLVDDVLMARYLVDSAGSVGA